MKNPLLVVFLVLPLCFAFSCQNKAEKAELEKLFVVGDSAIIWNTFTGTHQGELQGIPASGNKIEVSSILMWSLKNGKLVEEREEYNSLGLMMQLGMELKPKEVKK